MKPTSKGKRERERGEREKVRQAGLWATSLGCARLLVIFSAPLPITPNTPSFLFIIFFFACIFVVFCFKQGLTMSRDHFLHKPVHGHSLMKNSKVPPKKCSMLFSFLFLKIPVIIFIIIPIFHFRDTSLLQRWYYILHFPFTFFSIT